MIQKFKCKQKCIEYSYAQYSKSHFPRNFEKILQNLKIVCKRIKQNAHSTSNKHLASNGKYFKKSITFLFGYFRLVLHIFLLGFFFSFPKIVFKCILINLEIEFTIFENLITFLPTNTFNSIIGILIFHIYI